MEHPQVLHTPRLILRLPQAADIPAIIRHVGNPSIAATTLNIPHPYAEKDAVFWLNMANQGRVEKNKYIFAVESKKQKGLIGGIGLHINERFNQAEAGYWLAEDYWSQGLVSEALGAMLDFGFNHLKLHKIIATHLKHNPASGKVMSKNGMVKEGEFKEHIRKGTEYFDLIQYGLTQADYDMI